MTGSSATVPMNGAAVGTLGPNVDLTIALAVYPVIFLAELPDKSTMASLVMATRDRPSLVWTGAAAAFLVHVVIAVTVGVALFRALPPRLLDGLVAVMFLAGAVVSLREGSADPDDEAAVVERERRTHTVVTTAFLVIFVAEWGDLTQILTANLAAHYHSGLAVGIGAVAALWSVGGLAVIGGQGLLRHVDVPTIRRLTAVLLFVLAAVAAFQALR